MSTNKQRQELEDKIKVHYPELNPFALRTLLDLYFSEDGKVALDNIVKQDLKQQRKKKKATEKTPPPTEYITNVEVRPWDASGFEERIAEAREQVFKVIPENKSTVDVEETA